MKNRSQYREDARKRTIEKLHLKLISEAPIGIRYTPNSSEVTGDFSFDFDLISLKDLKTYRLLFPKTEYAKLRARKASKAVRVQKKLENEQQESELEK